MYPFVRLAWQLWRHRNDPPLALDGVHVSHHRCLPWDLDGFGEMNNGRVLTLFDLGRFTSARRFGLGAAMRRHRWGLAVAGSSVRYRRRILPMARIEMRTRLAGTDHRFFYILQEMWIGGECAAQALLRTAVTERGRSIPSARVLEALGRTEPPPPLPAWVEAWIAADAQRPWPPLP
ncbi:acyl-CoA thioesterase [Jannaschia sp. W003]|uniref:acyl-CoA thioesterase n=1 Tax=Jannaschia sp. W003 TaxID=2867012 RepID=UPI0021A7283F|nr:acyl-CoA thioesterase [Jannaschia sp. W003]UWQ22179.1 acyl-CoA thioesterase [Jannaschia sp. W003]